MRIGFDAKRLFNNFTGLGNYSRTLVRDLARYYPDNTYHLYSPKYQESPETKEFLHPSASNLIPVFPQCMAKNHWRTFGITENLNSDKIELYHGLSHEIPVGIKRKCRSRVIVTIHDTAYMTFPEMYTFWDRQIYDLKFRYSCHNSDHIIAISESSKKDIIRFFGIPEEKISVVYQAMNPLFYNMQSEKEVEETAARHGLPSDYLLFVGSINSRKNLLGIVKAMELLPQTLSIPLVVVGNGREYQKKVFDYVASRKISKRIIHFNSLHDMRLLQAFYQKATALIYPSFYEGFGLPVTEALLCKTAVITSNLSSLPEAGGEAAYYVNPRSIKDIATNIESLLTDTAERRRRIEEGYLFAQQKFNPNLITKQIWELYNTLS